MRVSSPQYRAVGARRVDRRQGFVPRHVERDGHKDGADQVEQTANHRVDEPLVVAT